HKVVPLIALAYVAVGLESHFSTGILYCRKTSWTAYTGLLALVVVLGWNYLFVPTYGILGAATSNLAGFVVRCMLIYYVSQRLYPLPYEMKRLGVLFLAAILLYIASQSISFPSPYLTWAARTGFVSIYPA